MRRLALALVLSALASSVMAQSPVLDAAWTTTLALLTSTDEARVAAEIATPDPACFGMDGVAPADRALRRRTIAASWIGRPVTWTIDGVHARGLVGPPMPAMPTVCMTYERGAWRYAGFIPGA